MNASRPRILITGFGPFPGAPVNPSGALALKLARSPASKRRDHAHRAELVLPTLWAQAAEFAQQLERLQPDIVLMIGLAARRRQLCIETRAVNRAGGFPDTGRHRPARPQLRPGDAREKPCAASPVPLVHALRTASLPARLSRDAGRYICNALAFTAYGWASEAPNRLAVFVHIPAPRAHLSSAHMARGLEAILTALEAEFAARRRNPRPPIAAPAR